MLYLNTMHSSPIKKYQAQEKQAYKIKGNLKNTIMIKANKSIKNNS